LNDNFGATALVGVAAHIDATDKSKRIQAEPVPIAVKNPLKTEQRNRRVYRKDGETFSLYCTPAFARRSPIRAIVVSTDKRALSM
jgi:hypothetical protein